MGPVQIGECENKCYANETRGKRGRWGGAGMPEGAGAALRFGRRIAGEQTKCQCLHDVIRKIHEQHTAYQSTTNPIVACVCCRRVLPSSACLRCTLGSAVTFDIFLDCFAHQPACGSINVGFFSDTFQRIPEIIRHSNVSDRCLGHVRIIPRYSVPCKHIQRVRTVPRTSRYAACRSSLTIHATDKLNFWA
jgi:hypothetical protein